MPVPMPDGSSQPELVRFESRRLHAPGAAVTARVARFQTDLATRVGDSAWSVLHAMGAHRWREGYETDTERGWSRYRGSRCTICDEPWEGW
jgi:hypothetical protein